MFNVPICLITLVDVERQWFKACVSLDVSETGRWEEAPQGEAAGFLSLKRRLSSMRQRRRNERRWVFCL